MSFILRSLFSIVILIGIISCKEATPEIPKSSAKEILSPTVSIPNANSSFDVSTNTYAYTVAAGTDLKTIAFSFSLPTGATSEPKSGSIQDFTNPVKYTITAEDGSKSVMTVTISFIKSSEKIIKAFDIDISGLKYPGKIDEANSKISAMVPKGTDLTKLLPIISLSARTLISPKPEISDFTKPKIYTLTAEDGTTRNYEIAVQIDNSIINYAPEKYLGSFEKNLDGIRAKIEEVLKVPIPKINRIYLWNRASSDNSPIKTENNTDVGELINDKTVNDLYSLKDLKSIYGSEDRIEKYYQSKTNFPYPVRPTWIENPDSWFWTFSTKTLFIYNDNEFITKYLGKNVKVYYGVSIGYGKLTNTGKPNTDNFISIGWDGN